MLLYFCYLLSFCCESAGKGCSYVHLDTHRVWGRIPNLLLKRVWAWVWGFFKTRVWGWALWYPSPTPTQSPPLSTFCQNFWGWIHRHDCLDYWRWVSSQKISLTSTSGVCIKGFERSLNEFLLKERWS